jgi:hypothetical protein
MDKNNRENKIEIIIQASVIAAVLIGVFYIYKIV